MQEGTNPTEQNTSEEHAPGTYFVADDGGGNVTLWRATDGDPINVACRYQLDAINRELWPLLAGVLAQDAETVERVARAVADEYFVTPWDAADDDAQVFVRGLARAALSGLLPGTEAGS